MRSEPDKTIFVNVQVLRAIAASLVVGVHLRNFFPYDESQDYLFRYGYAGVDLFFVISGFIMVVTTADRRQSAPSFFLNRICRIAPLYYLATLLVFVSALMAPFVFESTTASLGDLVNSLLFIPFEKSPDRIYPVYFQVGRSTTRCSSMLFSQGPYSCVPASACCFVRSPFWRL